MSTKRTISGRTVVITGAASGIGRALAQRLSAHSCPVAITDIDEKGLKETEASLTGPALLRVLDVADSEAQRDFAAEVADWAPRPIGAVFNNAGVATASSVLDAIPEDDQWLWNINFHGVVNGTRAFLPILVALSPHVPELPIVGHVPYGLVIAAIVWSLVGTGLLAVVGIKLPGLEFKNQRVEAAYRKELVYGEDDPERASPPTVRELFGAVRRNYFRLYFHYMYFNIARIFYLQIDNVFGLFLLFPSMVAGTITLGLMTQITNVFDQVRSSFQYLINSWTTLVELMSIYKRLRTFERELDGEDVVHATTSLS